MIVVKLMGGLGNQMFQYAAAKALAVRRNAGLALDTSFLEKDPEGEYTMRHMELNNFRVEASLASRHEIKKLRGSWFRKDRAFVEKGHLFQPGMLDAPDNTYLDGYWQSEKYFRDIRNLLLREFTLINAENADAVTQEHHLREVESVAVHVRRGDYVTLAGANQYHGVMPVKYYEDAVKLMNEKLVNPMFFVFSDDVAWCREHLRFIENASYISSTVPTAAEELIVMSRCRHQIIANSSFSWWGAWLNDHQNKIVVAPEKWYTGTSNPDLVPADYIRI